MLITKITATEVVVPAKPGTINSKALHRPLHKLPTAGDPGWQRQFDELPKLILQIELDNGVIALGECYRDHDWTIVRSIASTLLGQSLPQLNRQELPIALCREYDGFECAIWDGYAKSVGIRLVDFLGGPVRDTVLVGAWSGHRLLAEIGDLAASFAAQGYSCLKFKCDLEDDVVGWCNEIARAAPNMKVILDPNERWERVSEAKERIAALAPIGNVLCLEDPIPRWMIADYRELKQFSVVPIVLHVSLPYIQHGQRVHDAIVALQHRAVDGFNFNGGLAKFQQLDHIATAAHLPCWHGSEIDLGILEAMYVHQSAAAQSCIWPGDIFGRLIREHDLLKRPLALEPPVIKLPDGPGLGVELDVTAVAALLDISEGGPGDVGHAAEFETSLMLHIAPHFVDLAAIAPKANIPTYAWAEGDLLRSGKGRLYRPFKEMTSNGAYGDPTLASAAKGEQISKIVLAELQAIILSF